MITVIVDNKNADVNWVEFSDGAITCKVGNIPDITKGSRISVSVSPRLKVSLVMEYLETVMNALSLKIGDISRRSYTTTLLLHYLPYARADRVFEEGNPLGLKVFMDRLDRLDFNTIYLCDPHNPQAFNLTQHYLIKEQLTCFKESCIRGKGEVQYDYVVAPDKGAKIKAKTIADFLGIPLACADKERCVETGKIINTTFDVELPVGSHVIVVDDICDGGGTFIPLGEEIRSQYCTADIYWTHLIGTKGLGIFKGIYNKIYAYQTVGTYLTYADVMYYNQKLI